MTDLCVKFSAKDLRSYSAVKGEGFKELAQGLINIGAEHGKVDVNDVLPHPSTVSKKTSAVAQRVREEFLPEVKRALKEGACCFETDMWTDKFTKKAYLTLDCQFCTPDFELKTLTLFTIQFPADQKKTGENIRQLMEAELEKMGFDMGDVRKAFFNTDEGSNLKSALQDYNRQNCNAHVIATVLRRIFDFHKPQNKSFLFINAPETYKCINAVKNIVVYLKRSGHNAQLARTVKLMVDTRWNTLIDMLESFLAMLPEIIAILTENKEMNRLDGWDPDIALQLVNFLRPFKEVTLELQSKKCPTLHLVLIRFHDLISHCVENDEEHEVR